MSIKEVKIKRFIKYVLIMTFFILSFMMIYLSIYEPGYRNISILDLSDYPAGIWTWESPIFTYEDEERLYISQNGKGKILKAVIPFSENYLGFGIDKKVVLDSAALLEITWKGEGRTPYIQVDIVDGKGITENPDSGEIFSVLTKKPGNEWQKDKYRISSFERNRHQEEFRPNTGNLNLDNVLQLEFTFAPGTDLELDIKSIDYSWGVFKWDYIIMLSFFMVTILFFLSRHLLLSVYPHRGNEFYYDFFLNRVIHVFISIALVSFIISFHEQERSYQEYFLFGGLLFFILVDEVKINPFRISKIWTYRYFIVFFITIVFGRTFYSSVDFFVILGCFIPFINRKKRKSFLTVSLILSGAVLGQGLFTKNPLIITDMIVTLFSIMAGALLMEFFHYQSAKDETQEVSFLYETIFHNSSDGIFILDRNRKIISANEAFLRLLLFRKEDVIEHMLTEFIYDEDTYKLDFQEEQQLPNSRQVELRLTTKTQEYVYVLMREDRIISKGKTKGYQGIITDITERKKIEIELKTANERLNKIAAVDPLTQIANRRSFDHFYKNCWQKAIEQKTNITFILCDIDFFKLYNDHYGHQQGDLCLKEVANALVRATRKESDLVARYGGEEFIILLPGLKEETGNKMAERIVDSVLQQKIPHGFSVVNKYVTISAGVYTFRPLEGMKMDEMIEKTDQALYKAKENGKNRVVSANQV